MSDSHRSRLRVAITNLAILVAVALTACSTPAGEGSTDPGASQRAANPTLECVERGYPCSMAEVPQEIVERTIELGDQAAERIAGGESAQALVALRRSPTHLRLEGQGAAA